MSYQNVVIVSDQPPLRSIDRTPTKKRDVIAHRKSPLPGAIFAHRRNCMSREDCRWEPSDVLRRLSLLAHTKRIKSMTYIVTRNWEQYRAKSSLSVSFILRFKTPDAKSASTPTSKSFAGMHQTVPGP